MNIILKNKFKSISIFLKEYTGIYMDNIKTIILALIIIFGSLTHVFMKNANGLINNRYYFIAILCVIIQMTLLSKIYSLKTSMGIITTIYFISIVFIVSIVDYIKFKQELYNNQIIGMIMAGIGLYLIIK